MSLLLRIILVEVVSTFVSERGFEQLILIQGGRVFNVDGGTSAVVHGTVDADYCPVIGVLIA